MKPASHPDPHGRMRTFALILSLIVPLSLLRLAAQPNFSGKISGGFQAPTSTDAEGRRHVIRGKDVESRGNNVLDLTEPRVTRYNPDNTADMFIESARCTYNTKAGLASSDTNLVVRTTDGRFSIEGVGWHWDLNGSLLTISNRVVAVVKKAVLSGAISGKTNDLLKGSINAPLKGATNSTEVHINAGRFQQDGDKASFLGGVVVKDGDDTLKCERLSIQFIKPGGAQKIEAVGNVELAQQNARVRSGQAVYDVKENIIRISEHPSWMSDQREGSADLVVLNRATDTLNADGNVYMKLPVTNVVIAASETRTNQASTNRFLEIRSDRFSYQSGTNRAGTAVYTGHVQATQAEATLLCEQLTADFGATNRLTRLHAEGPVEIQSQKSRVFSRKADYSVDTDRLVLTGDPRWEIDQARGRSESLVFLPKTKEILALKSVEMVIPGRSFGGLLSSNATSRVAGTNSMFTITAETLSHGENVSVFQKDVRVSDARGVIECGLLTITTGASNQVRSILAEGGVAIKQPDLAALGDRAEYSEESGLLRLTGNPELLAPDKSLRAEVFVIDRNRNTFSVSPGKYRIQIQRVGKQTPGIK